MINSKTILLVEDDKVDVMTLKRAFSSLNIENTLEVVGNGEEALKYLKNRDNVLPGLILLDLNMPRMNGIELLTVLKANELFKKIPVIVLTTSNAEFDKLEAFNLSVAGYMVKPQEYPKFLDVIRAIELYWTISETPDDTALCL